MNSSESSDVRDDVTAALTAVREAIDELGRLLEELPEVRTPRGFGTLLGGTDDRK